MGVPNLQAWGVNDMTAQMGMQVGRSAVAAGQEYLDKHVSGGDYCKPSKDLFRLN